MNQKEREAYLSDLEARREVAHERDLAASGNISSLFYLE